MDQLVDNEYQEVIVTSTSYVVRFEKKLISPKFYTNFKIVDCSNT